MAFLMIFLVALLCSVCCIPSLVEWEMKRKEQKFYDSIKVGDKFYDPFYMDNPFEEDLRVVEVIAKKDGYVQYTVLWEDKQTACKSTKMHYEETRAQAAKSFYYEYKKYYR